jgi:hypothetical protein
MEEFKTAREETGKTRAEFGAVDLRPGEVEGLVADGASGSSGGGMSKSAALEKRKRDLEERRKLVDAKRRKKVGGPPVVEPSPNPSPAITESQATTQAAVQSLKPAPVEPVVPNPADDFLAQLERDIMSGKAR